MSGDKPLQYTLAEIKEGQKQNKSGGYTYTVTVEGIEDLDLSLIRVPGYPVPLAGDKVTGWLNLKGQYGPYLKEAEPMKKDENAIKAQMAVKAAVQLVAPMKIADPLAQVERYAIEIFKIVDRVKDGEPFDS